MCGKGQRASDLCAQAADVLLDRLEWERDSIKALIFVTQTPDLDTPSTAMLIQKRLNIGQDCICFDINLGCSGYIGGLQVLAGLLSNAGGRGLLLVGDGKYYNREGTIDANEMLFGDCGAATAIERQSDAEKCII